MPYPTLTYNELIELSPCQSELKAVTKTLGGPRKWNGKKVNARQAVKAGVSFSNLLWAASAKARIDKDVERRLRMWVADCVVRVLPIFEKECPGDNRPRLAIKAARDFAQGKITAAARAAAWGAARAAAGDAAWGAARAAAGDVEEQWQFDRLVQWLTDEPTPLRMPNRPKEQK